MMTAIPSRAASFRIIGKGTAILTRSADVEAGARSTTANAWRLFPGRRVLLARGGSNARQCRHFMTGDHIVSRTQDYSTSGGHRILRSSAAKETR